MSLDGSPIVARLKLFDGNLDLLRSVPGFTYDLANTPRIARFAVGVDLYHTAFGVHLVRGSTVSGHPVECYRMPFTPAVECVLALSSDGTRLLYSEVG